MVAGCCAPLHQERRRLPFPAQPAQRRGNPPQHVGAEVLTDQQQVDVGHAGTKLLARRRSVDERVVPVAEHGVDALEHRSRVGYRLLHGHDWLFDAYPARADTAEAIDGTFRHPFALRTRLGLEGRLVDGALRLEHPRGHELVPRLIDAFPTEVRAVTYGRPTLEDVFVHLTGRRLSDPAESA